MKEEVRGRKQRVFRFVGVIVGAIFALTLVGTMDTAEARGGYKRFCNAGKKWYKQYHKKHKKHIEPIKVECGQKIGPGGHYKLDADLDCSTTAFESVNEAVLTIEGPVTLDLRGHSIIGNSGVDGIFVDGDKAKIRRGTVTGCRDGVVIDGFGHHKIFKIKAVENKDDGFVISSDDNRLTLNKAIDNGDTGFVFEGNKNWFVKNRAENNDDEGFYGYKTGDQNKIYLNRAIGNGDDGIQVVGAENRVVYNVAKENATVGFNIDGDLNYVYRNRSRNNTENGIEIDGNENKIYKNRVKQNGLNGISIPLKTRPKYENDVNRDNVIRWNVVKENAEKDMFEYVESDSDGCYRNNIWQKNRFDTSNADCIE